MAVGASQMFQHRNEGITSCRNVLKLRKERKLAQERSESSVTETLAAHEQSGHAFGQQIGATLSEDHGVLSDRKELAVQDDWREVCLLSIL